jgi:hypothetical protein
MAFVISVLVIVYPALVVWLGVRIVSRRERWAKWTLATAASLPVLYFASFGPACWLDSRREFEAKAVTVSRPLNSFYYPIISLVQRLDNDVGDRILWYAQLFAPEDRRAHVAVLARPGARTGSRWLVWHRRDLRPGPWLSATPIPDE